MAVTAADLTYPVGEIEPEWFSGQDLAGNLSQWISQGYATASSAGVEDEAAADGVAEAFGYVRAYRAKARALAATPNSISIVGDIGVSGFTGQAKFFLSEAARWETVLGARLAAGVVPEEVAEASRPVSVATPNVFRF
jgi:hypothetical protein